MKVEDRFLEVEDVFQYNNEGYILKQNYLSEAAVCKLVSCIENMDLSLPGIVFEEDGKTPRAIQGAHLYNDMLERACRYSPLLSPAKELLQSNVYLHQFRINFKYGFCGGAWPWHQDFPFWKNLDNIANPHLINVMIFLDEISEFNGPLVVIPKSHIALDVNNVENMDKIENSTDDWKKGFANQDLQYQVAKPSLTKLAIEHGMVSNKGARGSVLFFNPELVHCSGPNFSPFQRRVMILTYNNINNSPTEKSKRPDFVSGIDFNPLVELNRF